MFIIYIYIYIYIYWLGIEFHEPSKPPWLPTAPFAPWNPSL